MAQEQKTQDVRSIEPCTHMETWVHGLSDGSLKGIKRAYTRFHIAGCLKCRTALQALEALHTRLERLDTQAIPLDALPLSPERLAALEAAMDAVEGKHKPGDGQREP